MKTLLTALNVERLKLRRSLIAPLVLAAPALVGIFTFANVIRAERAIGWSEWLSGAMTIWAFFLLPLSVTALCVLLASVEHAGRTWDHLRALASPRWTLYAAKAGVATVLTFVMSGAALALTAGAVALGAQFNPAATPTEDLAVISMAADVVRLSAAASFLIALQLWIALRFSSFVPALVAGIAGTFFAVVAPDAELGAVSPWQLPLRTLSPDAHEAQSALILAVVAGALAAPAMITHLSRREVV